MIDDNQGWIEHDGKGMPVDGYDTVNVKLRYDSKDDPLHDAKVKARNLSWEWSGIELGIDIIAYRVVNP